MKMNTLRDKIKTIIFNNGGLPGLNPIEYQTEMRKILFGQLSADEKHTLRTNNIHIDNLILQISAEIAEEIL